MAQEECLLASSNEEESRCELWMIVIEAQELHFAMHSKPRITGFPKPCLWDHLLAKHSLAAVSILNYPSAQ